MGRVFTFRYATQLVQDAQGRISMASGPQATSYCRPPESSWTVFVMYNTNVDVVAAKFLNE